MKIVKNRHEFQDFVGPDKKVGFINIRRKLSASELHAGHEHLIGLSKASYDLTAVCFWNMMELVYVLYNHAGAKQNVELLENWDAEGCLEWCRQRGVDVVSIPDTWGGVICKHFRNHPLDIPVYRKWVDQVWAENGYPAHSEDEPILHMWTLAAKACLIWTSWADTPNISVITSWKNGEITFILNDWNNKFKPGRKMIIVDPIQIQPGVYYSSSQTRFASTQKNAIARMGKVIDTIGHQNPAALKHALNGLDKAGKYSIGLKVLEIGILDGGVAGSGNVFVNVIYTMNGGLGYYPYYKKKGVI